MNSTEERLAALEQSTARIEGMLKELKAEVAHPTRVRFRKEAHFNPQAASRAAIDEQNHTLAVGLKLAGSFLLVALLVWVGFAVYPYLTRGLPPLPEDRIFGR